MIHKLVFIITLIFIANVASGQIEASLDDMANRGLASVFAAQNEQGLPVGFSVDAFLEYEGSERGMWICAVRFDLLIDGRIVPKYTYGLVGIGGTRDEARALSVREWLIAFGVPFCQSTLKTGDGLPIAGLIAYPGFLGIRGERPESWPDSPMAGNGHSIILSALLRVQEVQQLSPPFTLDLKIVISPNGGIESGECRLNGRIENELLAALENLSWPAAQSSYMVKQYYIIIGQ
jgi:hypothetical protein